LTKLRGNPMVIAKKIAHEAEAVNGVAKKIVIR
jgi:hypothetical protein